MTCWLRAFLFLAFGIATQGCLVLGLDRFYEEPSISFDERLLGAWRDADDNVTVTVEKSDWRSYRIQYVHPTETGALTGYLFKQGAAVYLDLVAVRGKDFGSFVIPAHGLVRVSFGTDAREVTIAPLSFDWFAKGLADHTLPATLRATKGERDQILLAGARSDLQAWLAARPATDPAFGPDAVFRKQ
ncbi:MAG TPA: hypothetical protein VES67_22445 [Vicinamibacterales bacterium]|nr:hypothetical protein [Vicinamibacterales bacterium]